MTELNPQIVLVVAAHADDNEFCFGGAVAKWVASGATVHYLVVTDGQRGMASADGDKQALIDARQAEQQAAADTLGVSSVTQLGYEDGRMELTWDLKKDIVKVIRELKPDTLLCMDPTFLYSTEHNYINHNDHRIVGQAVVDAVYPLARDETAFDELRDLAPHKVKNLLLFNMAGCNYQVDIADFIDKKVEAICCHKSQFGDAKQIEDVIRQNAEACAKDLDGCNCAEAFVRLELS